MVIYTVIYSIHYTVYNIYGNVHDSIQYTWYNNTHCMGIGQYTWHEIYNIHYTLYIIHYVLLLRYFGENRKNTLENITIIFSSNTKRLKDVAINLQ